jgi:PKD domain-containing protein
MAPVSVKVTDAPLSATASPLSATAGTPFNGQVATFTDADPNGTASDYSATINWGDGTTSAGTVTGSGPFSVGGTHIYAAPGSYQVTVSISDVGGSAATATGSAAVAAPAPPPPAPPALTSGAPSVMSTTSAAFTATVNPEGLATNVVFEYGPQLPDTTFTYSSTTPSQSAGSDFSSHTVSAMVTGLLPNTIYHVRVIATNSAGTTTGPDQTLHTPADPPPPPPVLGQSFDVQTVSGLVLVKLPHGKPLYAPDLNAHAVSKLTEGTGFIPLTEARRLPSGTQVDARLGTIKLIAATTKRRKTQTGTFKGGLFGLAQTSRGKNKGLTTLSLLEGLFPGAPTYSSCTAKKASDASSPTAYAARLSSRVLQSLHGSGHGRFSTRGRYGAATVRGTAWTISDRCDGTRITVQVDSVTVTDFVRHKTVVVHAGHSYLASAKPRRRK